MRPTPIFSFCISLIYMSVFYTTEEQKLVNESFHTMLLAHVGFILMGAPRF